MKNPRGLAALTIFLCFILASVFACPAYAANDQEKIEQARKSYYNLKHAGLIEFRCQVQLDWEFMLTTVKPDAVMKDEVLPLLKKMHFEVLVGPDGASTVSHQSEAAPPNEIVAARIRSITEGMEQILTGFFQTWSGFTINSMFPGLGDKFQLEDSGDKYRLTYGEKSTNVFISMNRDFTIDELRVATAQFDATVHPQFDKTDGGFLLTSYASTYKAGSSDPQQFTVNIDYAEVEKLNLPRTVKVVMPLPVGTVEIPLTFSNYQVKKS